MDVSTPSNQWIIDHPYTTNAMVVSCYDTNNVYVEPESIDFGNPEDDDPRVVVTWGEGVLMAGFAAIDDVGDIVSFAGVVPKDGFTGDMIPVQWRLSVETETDIYTSIKEGTSDASKFLNSSKTVHYDTYIYGTTDSQEFDDEFYYYTFKSTTEGLTQLSIRDYDVIGVELINTSINIPSKRRIVYSEMSGIYKPFGVGFVGHMRIYKDIKSGEQIIVSSTEEIITDHENVPLEG
jgi:hypothetical protein